MSILIKGIDIPEKENQMYMMELYADGHCSVTKIEEGKCYELTIPSETEAIQIPKGHGRIIDENKIDIPSTSVDMFENCRNCNLLDDEQVKEIIANAPTILEAEEQE